MRRLSRVPLPAIALACLAAIAWAGWFGMMHIGGQRSVVDRLEAPLTDLRLLIAGRRDAPDEVVIVAIDDATVAAEGGYPLDRRRLARLAQQLGAAGASTLAVDILLVDPTETEADTALVEALASLPSVIAAAGRFRQDSLQAVAAPTSDDELWPLPQFEQAAAIGLANVATDAGGTPRHLPLLFHSQRGLLQGFPLRAASLHRRADPVLTADSVTLGGNPVSLDARWHLPLRFYGPARSIRTVSAQEVLSGRGPSLSGSIVVLGVTATGVGDTFPTPFDPVTPGVEVQATGIAQLLDGRSLARTATIRRVDASLSLLLALGGVLLVLLVPLTGSLPIIGLVLVAVLGGTVMLFAGDIWMSAALPLVAAAPPIALAGFARQVHERRQARTVLTAETALRRFQPALLAERIATDPNYLKQPVEQWAAVLFLDLSGFTRHSEALGPARTQSFLKAFHTLVVDTVADHQGVVMNFMGDGAMIVFGIVEQAGNAAGRAFAAGLALAGRTHSWIETQQPEPGDLGLRLGLHAGPVVLARLGHDAHQQISVSGDTVNLASRLMEVAKAEGAVFAVSTASIAAMAQDGQSPAKPDAVHLATIRGRSAAIEVALWRHLPGETAGRTGD
ncbi:adenylate/guanylate cyclase domain-containing protein [Aurantimonas sp. A2-1-M11]|uniref:CHASE2 domain-containing protein n=1 Tax=Aurantimonas sp. A2-1-M11 TaxID=3113712 RepID=UPI002F94E6C3